MPIMPGMKPYLPPEKTAADSRERDERPDPFAIVAGVIICAAIAIGQLLKMWWP